MKIEYDLLIKDRINELRMERNVSEYQLSLDLGRSQGYIQSITSGRNLPSMNAFFDICRYFDTSPSDFLNPDVKNPAMVKKVLDKVRNLSDEDLILVDHLLDRLGSKQ